MHPVLRKTFGGLSARRYVRHLVFGAAMLAFFSFVSMRGEHPLRAAPSALLVLNTLLYPYSRFLYERIADRVMGENVFLVPALALLFAKAATMLACWLCAVLLAPLGLAYLYFRRDRRDA